MVKKIIDTGTRSAKENMSIDEELLLSTANTREAILHFYEWNSFSVTHGYFINTRNFFNFSKVQEYKAQLAKRPTGGGIVFHHCDCAFSFLIPSSSYLFSQKNILDNYAFINEMVLEAFHRVFGKQVSLIVDDVELSKTSSKHFCMAQPTKYDIILGNKKIGGAAQRKTVHGFLHQGSVLLGDISKKVFQDLLLPEIADATYNDYKSNSFAVLGETWTSSDLLDAKKSFKESLSSVFIS